VNHAHWCLVFHHDQRADLVGRRLGLGGVSHAGDVEIVGVVEDVKYTNPQLPTRPMIFFAEFQIAPGLTPDERSVAARSTLLRTLVVQTTPGAGTLEPLMRKALVEADASFTTVRVTPLTEQVSGNFRMNRLLAQLTGAYGVVALALASLGLYAVTAYTVARRTREIGVRMALGASRARVIRDVVRGALWQTALGLLVGLPAAWFAGQGI